MISPHETAFPEPVILVNDRVESASAYTGQAGVSIRTYVATKVLSGYSANPELWQAADVQLAEMAVRQADALIAELNKSEAPKS